MSKTLEGMARASVDADGCDGDYDKNPPEIRDALATDMKRALLWLADNVSDEMVAVVAHATSGDEFRQRPEEDFNDWTRRLRKAAISAAIRAAGEGR